MPWHGTYNFQVVVVVDPGTLAKCQCTPLPTRRYNHGEVASTIIELHCNSIAAPLGAGVDCYLTWILISRRDQVIRAVSQNHWWEWATFSQEGSRGKASPFASMLNDRSTPCRRRLSNQAKTFEPVTMVIITVDYQNRNYYYFFSIYSQTYNTIPKFKLI